MADLLLSRHSRQPSNSASSKLPPRQPRKSKSEAALLGKVSRTIRGANDAWLSWRDGLTVEQREKARYIEERKQILAIRLKAAETFKQWHAAAEELDTLEGNDEWKRDRDDGDYVPDLIEHRLRALDEARLNCDMRAMMHLIRTDLSRDLGGMGNVDLYRHSYCGTKNLIERYVQSTVDTIDAVVVQSAVDKDIGPRDLLESMLLARQSFGRSALLLSGGATFGMSHVGVLKALYEAQMLPRIISGASAGSIVCAVMCTRTDEEIPELIQEFPYGDLAVFGVEDSDASLLDHMKRLLTEGSWSDIKHLIRVMRNMCGDMTFQEAYNRTRRILNICVSTESVYELPRLLNYVTAPNVMIWSAVTASCSVPLVFHSSPLLVKDPLTGEHLPWNPSPQHFIDGSVDNDLPMTRLAEMFNVNHFIVSQVNPHVVPFLAKDGYLPPDSKAAKSSPSNDEADWINMFTSLAKDEALHRLQFMAEMGILPNLMTKLQSILSQKYSGDITIIPEVGMHDLPRLLANPTADFMLRSCISGERATWPKLSRIRDRLATELALDRAVHRLRTRVVFSESQRDLRKLSANMGRTRINQPVSISSHPIEPGTVQNEHRRRSGGSLSTLADRQLLFDGPGDITDEETAEEERLEMRARQVRPNSPTATRKPRLQRASKSHIHVPKHGSNLATSAMTEEQILEDFNFSKPITPPAGRNVDFGNRPSTSAGTSYLREPWGESARQDVTSPTDLETSEQGHSSDADIDQATEESDPDPYDSKWESPPVERAAKDDSMFGPEGRIGNGAWD